MFRRGIINVLSNYVCIVNCGNLGLTKAGVAANRMTARKLELWHIGSDGLRRVWALGLLVPRGRLFQFSK